MKVPEFNIPIEAISQEDFMPGRKVPEVIKESMSLIWRQPDTLLF